MHIYIYTCACICSLLSQFKFAGVTTGACALVSLCMYIWEQAHTQAPLSPAFALFFAFWASLSCTFTFTRICTHAQSTRAFCDVWQVFLSRGSTKRSAANPCGDASNPKVQERAARIILALHLPFARVQVIMWGMATCTLSGAVACCATSLLSVQQHPGLPDDPALAVHPFARCILFD